MIYAYLRVSTDRQKDTRLGLDAQLATIEEAFGPIPPENIISVDEGKSGGDRDRKGVMQILAMLKKGDVLAVAYSSRLARDADFAAWVRVEARKRGAEVRSADNPGNGEEKTKMEVILEWVNGLVDELRRYEIKENTAAAMEQKRQRGEKTGGETPFGYRISGYRTEIRKHKTVRLPLLEEDPEQQAIIAKAKRLHQQGKSLRAIARTLDLAHHEKVRRILTR